jgi:hypothetical protein
MTELGKSFYAYQETVIQGLNENMKVKMKKKLMKEFELVERVHETNQSIVT